jgi:hypothetical protein
MLCEKTHCEDAKPTFLPKDVVFINEYVAVNVPKFECCLFVLNEQICSK